MQTLIAFVTASLVTVSALNAQEQVVNGDFETGDLTGWMTRIQGSALGFIINDGTYSFGNGANGMFPPINGSFDATSEQTGPGVRSLNSCFTVPAGVTSATVTWTDTIRNFAPGFADPDQEFRVYFSDPVGTRLSADLVSTNPGDPLMQPATSRSFDVTTTLQGLEGQQVCLTFEEQDSFGFLHVSIDDVSLVTVQGTPPVQSAVVVFGAGCSGAGLPALGLSQNAGLPVRGTVFQFRIDQIPSGASASGVLLGFSQLAVDLTPFGSPGCSLWTDSVAVLNGSLGGTSTIVSYPIPNNAALAGIVLETQGFALVPGINPIGLITSNGLSLTIGDI